MQGLVSQLGTGGGHSTSAGGQIALAEPAGESRAKVEQTVLRRLLRHLHVRRAEGRPLLAGE